MKKEITQRLPNQTLEDLFITAMESGFSNWCFMPMSTWQQLKSTYKTDLRNAPSEYVWDGVVSGETAKFKDTESSDTWELTLDKIVQGTELFATEEPEHYANAVSGNFDAETADVWFQFCLLGEIVFG